MPMTPTSSFSWSIGTRRRLRTPALTAADYKWLTICVGFELSDSRGHATVCLVWTMRARPVPGGGRIGPRRINASKAAGVLTPEAAMESSHSHIGTGSQIRPHKSAGVLPALPVNTGSSSPGELEMTCRTSEVAVCCCSASNRRAAQLVEQPRVLDGDDRLGGEVLSPTRSACR